MSNPIQDVENFLVNIFKKLIEWITGAEKALKPVITIAENVLNGIKNFDGSVEGASIESLIEQLIPASTGLIDAFKIQLPVWLTQLNWIKDEANKTLDEQWADAQAYLNSIIDKDVKATQLAALKALFTKFFGSDGEHVVNIQQAITLSQVTHDPDKVIPKSN